MDNHIFRSALSGFNRQDVMAYIERTQKQAEEAAAGLEARLAELEQAAAGAREELAACQEEREDLRRQLEDMTLRYNHAKNNWDAQSEAKDSFRRDVAQRDETVRELTGENQRLFRQVQDLESQMDALRREKEKLTGDPTRSSPTPRRRPRPCWSRRRPRPDAPRRPPRRGPRPCWRRPRGASGRRRPSAARSSPPLRPSPDTSPPSCASWT